MAVMVSRTVVTPETDLGVVGASQTTEQTADDVSVDPPDLPGVEIPGADQDSDLPDSDTTNEYQSPGDLPQLEDETETVSAPEG